MNNFSHQDHLYMQRAIALAKRGYYTTSPNPRVGCVLVNNGKIVGEGFHEKAGEGHAEINALKQAGNLSKGCTVYVTLEPCSHFGLTPPCANALIDAGVKHVIAAMVDPNPKVSGRGLALLNDAGISTQHGLLEQDAQALNVGFIHRMITNKPYIRCKLAASLDGKTAMENGESQWITSQYAREDVQRLRAQSCAVICGADSVLFDNARMNVRWQSLGNLKEHYPQEKLRQPVRVIIDGKNRLTPDLAIFQEPSPIVLVVTNIENNHQWPYFVEQVVLPTNSYSDSIDLSALVTLLARKQFNDVLIESGARLAGAFIENNFVNELILYQAPKLMGNKGKSLVNFNHITALADSKALEIKDIRMVGLDIRITAQFLTSNK